MIDIKYLRSNRVAGLEFMKFQSGSLYPELVTALSGVIDNNRLAEVPAELLGLIRKYTGFGNIEVELIEAGNLGISAGYINPSNLFNMANVERYFTRSQSTLGQWFKNNKDQILKGTIDYETGTVGGAYSDLPFTLYINSNLTSYLDEKVLEKYKTTAASVLAAFIIHELGHAFGGVMMIHQSASDNLVMRAAIHFLTGDEYGQDRVQVLKDATAILDREAKVNQKDLDALVEKRSPDEYLLFFSKLASTRNVRRSLSLGVAQMNSEVIADAYAVRMGCGKSLVVGLSAITSFRMIARPIWWSGKIIFLINLMTLGSIAGSVIFTVTYLIITLSLVNLSMLSPGAYNTPYRRIANGYQEMILSLKSGTDFDAGTRRRLLNDLIKTKAILEDNKPFFEGTAVQRIVLWLSSGSDAKFIDIEHYTQTVANHEINVVAERFNTL